MLNKLRATYEMKFKSNKAEFDSILDTVRKNNDKEITTIVAEMKDLTATENMYNETFD